MKIHSAGMPKTMHNHVFSFDGSARLHQILKPAARGSARHGAISQPRQHYWRPTSYIHVECWHAEFFDNCVSSSIIHANCAYVQPYWGWVPAMFSEYLHSKSCLIIFYISFCQWRITDYWSQLKCVDYREKHRVWISVSRSARRSYRYPISRAGQTRRIQPDTLLLPPEKKSALFHVYPTLMILETSTTIMDAIFTPPEEEAHGWVLQSMFRICSPTWRYGPHWFTVKHNAIYCKA